MYSVRIIDIMIKMINIMYMVYHYFLFSFDLLMFILE